MADADPAQRFLQAPLNGLLPPQSLPGVVQAVDVLFDAARCGESICIYGDYDADGITATAILWQCLRLLGASAVDYYLPNRLEEGYGLNPEALRQIQAAGASVVVTVDCGIASL